MCRPKVFSVRRFSQLIWTTEQHINSVHNRKCRKLTHAYTFCRGVSVKYYLSSWFQNVVRTIKWPMRWRWECHWCSYRILTSSLTYDWVDPWQHKFILFYMITKKNSMLMTRSSRRLSYNTSYERITYRWMDPCNFFSKKDWKNRLTPTVLKIISYSYKIKFVHASCANAFLIAQRWFRCFSLTMLNPSINSPKKEIESPQFEIAALKKTFEDFRGLLNVAWSMFMSLAMTAKRVGWQYFSKGLWISCNSMAIRTMTLARKWTKVCNSSGLSWMSWPE